MGRSSPAISHLLFADDLIIFSRVLLAEADTINQCMRTYGDWSGQSINYSKSIVLFSKNLVGRTTTSISSILGLGKAPSNSKYLGLPLVLNRSKKVTFADISYKVFNCISGWKSHSLSQAGRGTLLNTVASAIPAYTMSIFSLPKNICSSIDAKMRNFWWGFKADKSRGLFLKGWDSICIPKSAGGMGFRHMHDVNNALLAKLDGLFSRILTSFGFNLSNPNIARACLSPTFPKPLMCLGYVGVFLIVRSYSEKVLVTW